MGGAQRATPHLPTFPCLVEGRAAASVRDSGATTLFVDSSLVPSSAERHGVCSVEGIEAGFQSERPWVSVHVVTPYFQGEVVAIALEKPVVPLVIGNSVTFADGSTRTVSVELPASIVGVATTRAAAKKQAAPLQPVRIPDGEGVDLKVDRPTLVSLQKGDPTLSALWGKAVTAGGPDASPGVQYIVSQG